MKSIVTQGEGGNMSTSCRVAQFVPVMLASTVVFAGDAVSPSPGPDGSQMVVTPTSLPVTPYSVRWLPDLSAYSLTDAGPPPESLAAMAFRNDSALARLGKIRNLSLLTLAEARRTRVYLGINADGMAGLHLVAFAEDAADCYLSLARLPYLEKKALRK